jgi:hypothetical protein
MTAPLGIFGFYWPLLGNGLVALSWPLWLRGGSPAINGLAIARELSAHSQTV